MTDQSMLDRAKAIPGWTSDAELDWLHQACAGKKLVIEFGAWQGRSTVAMCSAERVISVDTWTGSPGEEDHQNQIKQGLDCYGKWCLHTATYAMKIRPEAGDLRSKSFRELLIRKYGGQADLVFVDASHDRESVESDIELANKLLRPGVTADAGVRVLDYGGVLCGHDYGGSWHGVKAAVDWLVKNPRVVVGSIWASSLEFDQ